MRTRSLCPGIFTGIIITVCIICYLCNLSEARTGGRRWAVVVGIDTYFNNITPLRCAVNDAEQFKKALAESAGFDDEDIFTLTSKEQGNRMPTRMNIIKRVTYIKNHAGSDDTFVLFFSGHGMEKGGESYLLTIDADPENKDTLDMSALRVSDLKRIIEDMPAQRILFFVDACRNDPSAGKGDVDNPLTDSQSKNLVIRPGKSPAGQGGSNFSLTFFSCKVGQRSYEWTEERLGFFTYYLVKGIRGDGKARDSSGNVTLGSLKKYLGEKVAQAIEREKGGNMKQEPWVKGDASIDADAWVFAGAGSSHAVVTKPAPETPSQSPSPAVAPVATESAGTKNPRLIAREEAEQYISNGDDYFEKKEYDRAIEEYTRAIEKDRTYALAYNNRGNAYIRKADYNRAIEDYNIAIALNPDHADAYNNRGSIYAGNRDYDKAIDDYNKAIAINPDHATAYFSRGNAYAAQGDHDRAIDDYTRAIAIAPHLVYAYSYRAKVYHAKKDYDRAIADYTKAIAMDPNYAILYRDRGYIYYHEKKDYDRAMADYTKAIAIDPNYVYAYFDRGVAYKAKGEHDKAIADLRICIQKAPSNDAKLIKKANNLILEMEKR